LACEQVIEGIRNNHDNIEHLLVKQP